MSVLNVGSINIDHVYRVPSLTKPGETIEAYSLETFYGGKGLNQSVALVRAGATVYHAGCIGIDGDMIKLFLSQEGVNVGYIRQLEGDVRTGHAIIQVSNEGENNIVIYGGANRLLSEVELHETLDKYVKTANPKFVLVQNETNLVASILEKASKRGLITIWNPAPSPRDDDALESLQYVDYLILNESEGCQMVGATDSMDIIGRLLKYCKSSSHIILTLGSKGLIASTWDAASFKRLIYVASSVKVDNVVDTTAAGDTFVGFFTAAIASNTTFPTALRLGTAAAALCVQRHGASSSIPLMSEVRDIEGIKITESIHELR